eukprot:TRINITY_DN4838_c0_g1_i1.p1 TRINITY_DN4838_c0_g1~~TRINITY_DN4838_c0_g1_i1.p1  ORF type:complete len:949 (-),score=274.11 TRINITY_DN4838_c0_g1_i1:119-2821(-)
MELDENSLLGADGLLHPDNPLLKRIQEALTKQLQTIKDQLIAQARLKEDELRATNKRREELGVELYGVQQQLASIHGNIEKMEGNLEEIRNKRLATDSTRDKLQSIFTEKKDNVASAQTKYEVLRSDLEKLNQTIHQVELHSQEMEKQVLVAKRAAHKAEEDIVTMEDKKAQQDILIDSMVQQIQQLEQAQQLYEAQLSSQKEETKAAKRTLGEASQEMEAISVEKKLLLQQWKSSLLGLARRDELLREKEAAVQQEQETLLALATELNGYKNGIKKEQDLNEQLTSILNKVTLEHEFLSKKIAAVQERRDRLTQEYSQYQKALEKTEAELASVIHERSILEDEVNTLHKQGDHWVNETVKLDLQIRENLQVQKTLEKGSSSTEQSVGKLALSIEEKQMQIAQLQNEMGRIRVDSLNTMMHNQELETTLKELIADLREKDSLIEKFESEIRRRNDEIERKQTEVDRLNRKYDGLISNIQDENTGPLEATIHNLTNEIAAKKRQCADLESFWLRSQTELVHLNKQNNKVQNTIQGLRAQHTVMNYKHLRLNNEFMQHTKEIKEMEGTVRILRNDMVKLNDLIAKNSSLQTGLSEETQYLETELMSQLREMEIESIDLEDRITSASRDKDEVMSSILEVESMALLWEKKIQLSKETAQAIDPNVGAAETHTMRKEIARMKLKLTNLKREQELLIQDMERSVLRRESFLRETLLPTYLGSKPSTGGASSVEHKIKREISEMGKKVKQLKQETAQAESTLQQLHALRYRIRDDLEKSKEEHEKEKEKSWDLERQCDDALEEKQRRFEQTTLVQSIAKKYSTEIPAEKYDARVATLDKELSKQVEKTVKIQQLYTALIDQFPSLIADLNTLASSTRAYILTPRSPQIQTNTTATPPSARSSLVSR